MCLYISPGHARQVAPEIASAVGSRDLLGIDHHWVTLRRSSRVTSCFTQREHI